MRLEQDTTQFGIMSAMLGTISMIAWLIPIAGAIVAGGALFSGTRAIENEDNGWPLAGLILGGVGMALTIIRSGLVYYYG